jgi:hypothetical protein
MRSREERRQAREARDAALDAEDREAAERLSRVSLEHHPYPLFTEAAPAGKCPQCRGIQFRRPPLADGTGGLVTLAGIAGLAISAVDARKLVECVTCGKKFRKG